MFHNKEINVYHLTLIFESSISLVTIFHHPLINMCSVQTDVLSVMLMPSGQWGPPRHAQVIHSWPAHREREAAQGQRKEKKNQLQIIYLRLPAKKQRCN